LLAEGLRPETVIKAGSPMKEVLAHHRNHINGSDVLARLELRQGEFFLVSAHREENIDSETNFENFLKTLLAVSERYDKPVIVSTHPRTRKRLEERGKTSIDDRIQFLKPLGFADFVKLQMNAACVISDSGTITEESSILGFPAVTIRQAHERPEGMDEGTLIMCGLEEQAVIKAIDVVISQLKTTPDCFRTVNDYDVENVSNKVLRIILSYTDYINRTVWKKFV
jgi:UDP-N-acetylglucosamine 2-epimerase (non-hydrolysing)